MDYKEFPLANTSDLSDGEMKEVSANGTRILLARVGGEFHAVGAACPHYGAPLVEGRHAPHRPCDGRGKHLRHE
jgi:nitrite reductase/ring-hydroxylating ferredoxin subunit